MNIKQIQDLIKFVSESGVCEVEIEKDGFKLRVKTNNGLASDPIVEVTKSAAIPAPAPTSDEEAQVSAQKPQSTESGENIVEIKAPMIGTFYRRPSPDKELFINVGDQIEEGQVICIIEAMKLFNEIESEVSGKVVKILVEDSSPVEYDQPLVLVESN